MDKLNRSTGARMTSEIVGAEMMGDAMLAETLADVAGQLAPSSAQTYTYDAQHFASWLAGEGLDIISLDRASIIRYRKHLQQTYAKSTAARMLTVARRLLAEAVKRDVLPKNVAADIRGFRGSGDNDTPHAALTRAQARELLATIDCTSKIGLRDYALIMLLLRTGLRRSEAAGLTLGDMGKEQGHHILTVRHGKGDKRRTAKVPVDVLRAIMAYVDATGRSEAGKTAPLFVAFDKGDHPTQIGLSDSSIERIVKKWGHSIGVDLVPHGLRASFVTLALEGGAALHDVQYAAGHADPRTTERYQKRKLNLDRNAVDFIHL